MNIYQLSGHYQQIMDRIDQTDEIDEATMESLLAINEGFENKIMSYASIIKTIEAKAKAIDDAVKAMCKRQEKLFNSANRLKDTVKAEMEKCEKKKIENEYHVARIIQNNPKVGYSDKNLIPDQYWRKKIQEVIEPNTLLISKALKENVEVPGAFLVQEQRLEIR